MIPTGDRPVLIVGAGISGLLLAQSLSRHGIPFRVFERDTDLETRGVGWGLTLLWTLPTLKDLLPEHLFSRLPEAYVDREAVLPESCQRMTLLPLHSRMAAQRLAAYSSDVTEATHECVARCSPSGSSRTFLFEC
ncbi:hypothetical protein LB505_012638 [Fusarium chuoi]|nr:hypothetical protein LB505_012638 [Fusarium chuoi]